MMLLRLHKWHKVAHSDWLMVHERNGKKKRNSFDPKKTLSVVKMSFQLIRIMAPTTIRD